MDRIRRHRQEVEESEVDTEEVEGVEEDDESGDEVADLLNEPSFDKVEGETMKEAQDRIEDKYRARAKSPLKAIRAFCVLCMGAQPREVAHCTATKCVLYPFRFGRNPFQRRG